MSDEIVKAGYSYLPSGSGDGYGYGGGAVVTIGRQTVFFGEGNAAHKLALFVAEAVNAFNKPLPNDDEIEF